MKYRSLIGWMCTFLMLCAVSTKALDVKFMSYNIRYGTAGDGADAWNNRRDLMTDQLRRQAADIIGMQEAMRFQIDEIRRAIPFYGEVGIGRDGGEKGEYSCILYDTRKYDVLDSGTFWLSETPEKRSQDWNSACVRICTWALFSDKETSETFYHFNTHLDHQSAEARIKGVQLIAARISARKPGVPFVLTGDFNAAEDSPPLSYLKGKTTGEDSIKTPVVMADSFRILHPDATEVGTFNRFKGDRSGAKIDYVLVAPDTGIISAAIDTSMPDGRCISDHFPVTAVLRFPEPDSGG